jgi:predicted HTH domain antitoxin
VIVSVDIPDQIAAQLNLAGEKGQRRALEMFALEGYRSGQLSRGQVGEMLDLELNETMRFLKEHGCAQSITLEEFEQDRQAMREFLSR